MRGGDRMKPACLGPYAEQFVALDPGALLERRLRRALPFDGQDAVRDTEPFAYSGNHLGFAAAARAQSVIDGRGLDQSRPRRGREQQQREAVRPSGNRDPDRSLGIDQGIEIASETLDGRAIVGLNQLLARHFYLPSPPGPARVPRSTWTRTVPSMTSPGLGPSPSLLAALRLRLGVGDLLLEVRAYTRAIDRLELAIGLARLARLTELHQRLAEVIEAVGCALALRVVAIIGEQRLSRGARIALVEQGAADEVVGIACAAMLGVRRGEGAQRGDRV